MLGQHRYLLAFGTTALHQLLALATQIKPIKSRATNG
jgi:hypothetical protein